MSIGQAINNLIQSIPAILTLVIVYRLVANELYHIVVEQVKPEIQDLEKKIEEAKSRQDIILSAYVSIDPLRRIIHRWSETEDAKKVIEKVKQILSGTKTT